MVPTDRVAPILRRTLEETFCDGDIDASGLSRTLYRWEFEVEYVGFDTVDAAFCSLNLDVWRIWNEDLRDIYLGLTFRETPNLRDPRRCRGPGCLNPTELGERGWKRYCCDNCKAKADRERRRVREGRAKRTGGKYDRCVHGHDRSPENTSSQGKCLRCKSEYARRKYKNDTAHRRKVVQSARDRRARQRASS